METHLTGQCKTDFEAWYINTYGDEISHEVLFFYTLPLSAQFGIYQDFFESKDILFSSEYRGLKGDSYMYKAQVIDFYSDADEQQTFRCSLQEYLKKAIQEANKLYNESIKKHERTKTSIND